MKNFWEQRYSEDGFAYGIEPNDFLVTQREFIKPGNRVLVAGDGEGRNGVWLSEQGLDVTTVDYSETGLQKARELASSRNMKINTICADLTTWQWPEQEYDLVIAIYIHFSSEVRPLMHKKMLDTLKPGGILIMEAFTKDQLKYKSGGPPVKGMLYELKMLENDFADAEILYKEKCVTDLNEGRYHVGPGSVIRLVLQKPENNADA